MTSCFLVVLVFVIAFVEAKESVQIAADCYLFPWMYRSASSIAFQQSRWMCSWRAVIF